MSLKRGLTTAKEPWPLKYARNITAYNFFRKICGAVTAVPYIGG